MSDFNTRYGFNFGSMEVTRTCGDEFGNHVISVKTPKKKLSIRSTPTGQLRFYDDKGNELKLVDK